MEATYAGLVTYLEQSSETPAPGAARALLRIERAVIALILPRAPRLDFERVMLELAVYAQYQFERNADQTVLVDAPARLKSFKLGELSATLDSLGLTREQALFPAGLCPESRSLLLEAGLLYRGVDAC